MSNVGSYNPTEHYASGVGSTWYVSHNTQASDGNKYVAYEAGGHILTDNETTFTYDLESMSFVNAKGSARWFRVYGPMANTNYGGVYTTVKVPAGEGRTITVNPGVWRYFVTKGHSAQTIVGYWRVDVCADSACTDKRNTWTFAVYSNVDAKPSYTVAYSANGGSSTPGSQTKWYNESLTLQGAISHANTSPGSYTVTLNGNGATNPSALTSTRTTSYSFRKWKASNGTEYSASSAYTANAGTTMTAQWNTSETRANVTLPNITRTNYTFNGWYTAASGGSRIGGSGATYNPSGNATFYAQWTQIYASPQISIEKVYRCSDYSGTPDDEGEYAAVECSFKIWKTAQQNSCAVRATANYKSASRTLANSDLVESSDGKWLKGSAKLVINAALGSESAYSMTVKVTDTQGGGTGLSSNETTKTAQIASAYYTIDFLGDSRLHQPVANATIDSEAEYYRKVGDTFVLSEPGYAPTGDTSAVAGKIYYTATPGLNLFNGTSDEWSDWVEPTVGETSWRSFAMTANNIPLVWATQGRVLTMSLEIEFDGVEAGAGETFVFKGSEHFKSAANASIHGDDNATDWGGAGFQDIVNLSSPPSDGVYQYDLTATLAASHVTRYGFSYQFQSEGWAAGRYRVRKLKLEIGDTATAWSPSYVEDPDAYEIEEVASPSSFASYYEESVSGLYETTGPRPGHGVSFGAPSVHESMNIAMPPECYGEPWVPTFKTSSIENFVVPNGVDECLVYDISVGAIYKYENGSFTQLTPYNAQLKLSNFGNYMNSWLAYSSEANYPVGFGAWRSDTGVGVDLEVGSGGVNHGVWSFKLSRWLLYADSSNVYVNGVVAGKELKWIDFNRSYTNSGGATFIRMNGMVHMQGSANFKGHSSRTAMCNVPAGWRPYGQCYGRTTDSNGGVLIVIDSNGNISFDALSAGNHWFSAMWAAWN